MLLFAICIILVSISGRRRRSFREKFNSMTPLKKKNKIHAVNPFQSSLSFYGQKNSSRAYFGTPCIYMYVHAYVQCTCVYVVYVYIQGAFVMKSSVFSRSHLVH